MGFVIGAAFRRYWQYFLLAALILATVFLARRNGVLNAELDRTVDRIEAIKEKERLRRDVQKRSDSELIDGLLH